MDQNNILEFEQGSEEWLLSRVGKVTASKVTDVMAKLKTGKPSASRITYMGQLIAERLTGQPTEFYCSPAMQHGTDTEPQARAAYSFINDVDVVERGLVDHESIPMFGASCDGFIGDDGLVEFKCPNTSTHIDYLITKKIPKKYFDQMQAQMSCTGRKWCDFMSFDPRMPEHLNKLIIRVDRDNKYIEEMEKEVILFNNEIIEKLKVLENL